MSEIQFYVDLAVTYFSILAIAILMLFLFLFMVLSHLRRVEQKLNFLIRNDQELYQAERKKYRFYK